MKKLELLPNHPLARVCDALNLLDWFEGWIQTVHTETLEPRRQEHASSWQTVGDIQLEYAHEIIARVRKATDRKTISEDDLKIIKESM